MPGASPPALCRGSADGGAGSFPLRVVKSNLPSVRQKKCVTPPGVSPGCAGWCSCEVRWNACAPVIRPAVGPNRTASYLPATLAVMRHGGDQMRLVNLLGGSFDRRVDRGKVRHIPRGLSGLPEFAPLPG